MKGDYEKQLKVVCSAGNDKQGANSNNPATEFKKLALSKEQSERMVFLQEQIGSVMPYFLQEQKLSEDDYCLKKLEQKKGKVHEQQMNATPSMTQTLGYGNGGIFIQSNS